MRSYLRIGLFLSVSLFAAFSLYVWSLYGQLRKAFGQQEQFIPTRIYSDVTRIAPPQNFQQIERRLKNLGYSFQVKDQTIQFTLHSIDYPLYLVPDSHPIFEMPNPLVVLRFSERALQTIEVNGKEASDLYLEPELIATWSKTQKTVRELVKFTDIPAAVWKAIIAVEDQHFLDHKGFDLRGIARAIWVNLRTGTLAQGGSTITQQLVKNLMERRSKNLFRKLNELFLAVLLENTFEKEQILERYLNEVYLGQIGHLEIHGVAEGARHFFAKKLEDLNIAEIALMAGLIRGPGYYSPYRYRERALERQRLVLKKMVETGQVAEEEMIAALKLPIRLAPPLTSTNKAPYFTDFVKAELIRRLKGKVSEQEIVDAGFKVYTTLDPTLNLVAQNAVTEGTAQLEKRFKVAPPLRLEAALASVDHSTGAIRALIGGRGYAQSTFNRILNMKRQVGSAFKPFVYLTALKKTEGVPFGPAYPMEDAPWKLIFDRGKQTWTPKNYEKSFMGWIPLRTALAHSINTVAARLGLKVGLEEIIKTARALGIEAELPAVPSLSLGVAELSPVELLRAYATVANHGIQVELTVLRGITQHDDASYMRVVPQSQRVMDSAAADLLTDMLQTVFSEGTARGARQMGFERPAAGKTGTTSHHRDAWFAGYAPQLTTVVWVGMDQNPEEEEKLGKKKEVKIKLTGADSALPIWTNYMRKALQDSPSVPFPPNEELTEVQIDRHSGKQATSDCPSSQTIVDQYMKGHEPKDRGCETNWPPSIGEEKLLD